jgi:hypothetical protein
MLQRRRFHAEEVARGHRGGGSGTDRRQRRLLIFLATGGRRKGKWVTGLSWAAKGRWAGQGKGGREGPGQIGQLSQKLEVNRKINFQFLAAEMNEFK